MNVAINKRFSSFMSILTVCATAALLIFFGGISLQANAETLNGLSYSISDGKVTITACDTSLTGEMNIPAEIDGYPVTSIYSNAFYNCTGLTEITIPNSVTSIGGYAFYGCTELITVNYNAVNCTTAGSNDYPVFSGCIKLTTVNIGTDVTLIPSYVFCGCTGLTEITIPYSVTSIGSYAFYCCRGLTEITIPNSVTSIGDSAFRGCTELVTVNYNAVNCTTVGSYYYPVFSGCNKLTTVNIGTEVTLIPSYVFKGCTGLTEITIPNSVTSIGDSAFYGCSGLTEITIPNSVTSIGDFAFSGCSRLASANIPCNVDYLGCDVFYESSALTTIYYNATNCTQCSKYGDETFLYGCGNLKTIVVGENVESLPDYVFANCPSLEKVVFLGDSRISIGAGVFDNSYNATIHCRENSFIHSYAEANGIKACIIDVNDNPVFEVKNDVLISYLGDSQFVYVSAASRIGFGAFSGNTTIRTVELSGEIVRIYNDAFKGCTSLQKIIIPQGVASIGDNAFDGCTNLTIFCYAGSYAERYAANHDIPISRITLSISHDVVQINADESLLLSANFSTPLTENQSIKWSSDDSSIVSVDTNGNITAVSEGVTTITALSENGLTASCRILVRGPHTYVNITSDNGSFVRKVKWWWRDYRSEPIQLSYSSGNVVGSNVKWTSDNKRVVVDENGKVTNKSIFARSATITVTVYDSLGNEVASDSVKVMFYKFDWQKSRLESQSVVSNNIYNADSSPEQLDEQETENSTYTSILGFFLWLFSLFNKAL